MPAIPYGLALHSSLRSTFLELPEWLSLKQTGNLGRKFKLPVSGLSFPKSHERSKMLIIFPNHPQLCEEALNSLSA